MIFQRFFTPPHFFSPRAQVSAGRALFASANGQARNPAFYGEDAVPDTYEGRFELLALHVVLLLHRLKGDDPHVAETRQGLFDTFVRNLDDGLREMGVGDLSVGKKMRKLGAAVYGRLKSYNEALQGGETAVVPLLIRTVFADAPSDGVHALAAYVIEADAALAALPTEQLLQGEATWPPYPR
jgi:cytochrome b pre-mRNA-processing protein 3